MLIAELVGNGFIVAIILDRLISNSFAMTSLRVIVEVSSVFLCQCTHFPLLIVTLKFLIMQDVGKLAVVSFSKRMIAESLTKSYYSALLRAASQVQSTFGFVSHHTLNMVFMYPSAGPVKTASPATPAANSSPMQAKSDTLNTASFISNSDTKMGWMQYFSIVMRRLSPFRSSAQLHKVTPEVVQPSTSSAQPPTVYVCPYLEIITSSVDQIVDDSFDKPSELELASTAPGIIQSIVQHLQVQPRRAPWEVPPITELYLYDPEDRSLSRPTSLIESGSHDEREEIRPALSTGPTTVLRNEGTENRTSGGRKDNSVYAQQQRQAAQLKIVHFPEQQLVAVFQRKAGAGAGIEHDHWESQGNNSQNSVELMDFQLWAKSCLVKKMVPGVKQLPVDIL